MRIVKDFILQKKIIENCHKWQVDDVQRDMLRHSAYPFLDNLVRDNLYESLIDVFELINQPKFRVMNNYSLMESAHGSNASNKCYWALKSLGLSSPLYNIQDIVVDARRLMNNFPAFLTESLLADFSNISIERQKQIVCEAYIFAKMFGESNESSIKYAASTLLCEVAWHSGVPPSSILNPQSRENKYVTVGGFRFNLGKIQDAKNTNRTVQRRVLSRLNRSGLASRMNKFRTVLQKRQSKKALLKAQQFHRNSPYSSKLHQALGRLPKNECYSLRLFSNGSPYYVGTVVCFDNHGNLLERYTPTCAGAVYLLRENNCVTEMVVSGRKIVRQNELGKLLDNLRKYNLSENVILRIYSDDLDNNTLLENIMYSKCRVRMVLGDRKFLIEEVNPAIAGINRKYKELQAIIGKRYADEAKKISGPSEYVANEKARLAAAKRDELETLKASKQREIDAAKLSESADAGFMGAVRDITTPFEKEGIGLGGLLAFIGTPVATMMGALAALKFNPAHWLSAVILGAWGVVFASLGATLGWFVLFPAMAKGFLKKYKHENKVFMSGPPEMTDHIEWYLTSEAKSPVVNTESFLRFARTIRGLFFYYEAHVHSGRAADVAWVADYFAARDHDAALSVEKRPFVIDVLFALEDEDKDEMKKLWKERMSLSEFRQVASIVLGIDFTSLSSSAQSYLAQAYNLSERYHKTCAEKIMLFLDIDITRMPKMYKGFLIVMYEYDFKTFLGTFGPGHFGHNVSVLFFHFLSPYLAKQWQGFSGYADRVLTFLKEKKQVYLFDNDNNPGVLTDMVLSAASRATSWARDVLGGLWQKTEKSVRDMFARSRSAAEDRVTSQKDPLELLREWIGKEVVVGRCPLVGKRSLYRASSVRSGDSFVITDVRSGSQYSNMFVDVPENVCVITSSSFSGERVVDVDEVYLSLMYSPTVINTAEQQFSKITRDVGDMKQFLSGQIDITQNIGSVPMVVRGARNLDYVLPKDTVYSIAKELPDNRWQIIWRDGEKDVVGSVDTVDLYFAVKNLNESFYLSINNLSEVGVS